MVIGALGVAAIVLRPAAPAPVPPGHLYAVPGEGRRVTVEVLNATAKSGLARVATRALRQRGFDVVASGNAEGDSLDRTRVLARRGDVAAARQIAEALGVTSVEAAADSSRRVDVTVELGADFRPTGPLHP